MTPTSHPARWSSFDISLKPRANAGCIGPVLLLHQKQRQPGVFRMLIDQAPVPAGRTITVDWTQPVTFTYRAGWP